MQQAKRMLEEGIQNVMIDFATKDDQPIAVAKKAPDTIKQTEKSKRQDDKTTNELNVHQNTAMRLSSQTAEIRPNVQAKEDNLQSQQTEQAIVHEQEMVQTELREESFNKTNLSDTLDLLEGEIVNIYHEDEFIASISELQIKESDEFQSDESETLGDMIVDICSEAMLIAQHSVEDGKQDTEASFEKFMAYLDECVDLETKVEVVQLMDQLLEISDILKTDNVLTEERIEEKAIELKRIIQEIFMIIGIEADDEKIDTYVQILIYRLRQQAKPTDVNYDIDYLNRMGTWEYKPTDNATLLNGVIQTSKNYIDWIGRFVLTICLPKTASNTI